MMFSPCVHQREPNRTIDTIIEAFSGNKMTSATPMIFKHKSCAIKYLSAIYYNFFCCFHKLIRLPNWPCHVNPNALTGIS